MSVSNFSPSSTNTESSLNLYNLNTALETLADDEWYDFGVCLDVPESQLDEIRSQYSTKRERKSALLHTYLTSHPAPSWQHIADALYRLGWGKFHAVLEGVQTMFPTGKKMCQCCVVLLSVLYLTIGILVYGLLTLDACIARVTVLGWAVCVCVSVCYHVFSATTHNKPAKNDTNATQARFKNCRFS